MESENNVRAHAGNQLAHIVVQAAHDGRNADYNGNPDYDSEHSQSGAHLIGAQGISGHLEHFPVFASAYHVL